MYGYPLDEEWSKEEIIDVVNFFSMVERTYETGVNRSDFLRAYEKFKKVVPAKSEEKRHFAEFQKDSSYSAYALVKLAKETTKEKLYVKK